MEDHMERFASIFNNLLRYKSRLSIRFERSAKSQIRNVDYFIKRLHKSNSLDVPARFLCWNGRSKMVESIFALILA